MQPAPTTSTSSAPAPGLSAAVIAARESLAAQREKLRQQHYEGFPGVQVCAHFTDELEAIVVALFQDAFSVLPAPQRSRLEANVALVAHSGFGRREMAPYSDLDLMLLVPGAAGECQPLIRRFSQHLYDTGMEVGFAARGVAEACALARHDATVLTALSAARLIAGSQALFDQFDARFRRQTRRHWKSLLRTAEASRKEERGKYGETVFLLEPNVKRSRGGLRELQLIRWIGFVRYGESDFDALAQAGWLTKEEQRKVKDTRDFLLWLRNELHFHAGAANDVLDRGEQLRIAGLRKYEPVAGLMPVEQFMREYFQHTSGVREIAANFAASARPRPLWKWLAPLITHRFEDDFRVGPNSISATRRGLARLRGDLAEVLSLLDLANFQDKRVDDDTWREIRLAMLSRGPADASESLPTAVSQRFLSLLAKPARLGELLRRLHDLRVLEQLIPAMTHARGLLQFNAYHHYTVDEHSIRVVEHLASLQTDPGHAGEVYRSIRNKALLHLTALLHDLGKGYGEDHSVVGERLAAQTAARLGLSEHDAEIVRFLVLKHLRMSHLAQQHDIHDDNVVVPFAAEVGTPEALKMLYVLTLADWAAVGPGVLNEWKQQLLTDLYEHTLKLIASDSPVDAAGERVRERREALLQLVRNHPAADWWRTQIAVIPAASLFASEPAEFVAELEKLRQLPHRDAIAWGKHLASRNVVEYTVGTYEEITSGIFHKLTGTLTARRHQILSAEINTLAEGLVLDRFYVRDQDFSGPPPPERIAEVSRSLVEALQDHSGQGPVFRKLWRPADSAQAPGVQHLPTRVNTDNTTAEHFTIIATFAYDRMGLLYTIARTLFELGLSVSKAKIGTYLDQVVDVFYVTDQRTGGKITDEHRLSDIRSRLYAAIEEVAEPQ